MSNITQRVFIYFLMIPSHQSNTATELELIFLQGNQRSAEVNCKIFNNLFANFSCNGGKRDLTIVFSAIFSTFLADGNRERWYFARHLYRFPQGGKHCALFASFKEKSN